jgi:hypothetical protein
VCITKAELENLPPGGGYNIIVIAHGRDDDEG